MSTLRFNAHCAQGHTRITFTDPAAFESHMTEEHGARKLTPGGPERSMFMSSTRPDPMPRAMYRQSAPGAPGWSGGKPAAPHPHKAPRPVKGGLEKVTEKIAAGEYVWPAVRGWGRADQPAAVTETDERAA